jgi:hypothetical protein
MDDCSTDESRSIISKYAIDSRVRTPLRVFSLRGTIDTIDSVYLTKWVLRVCAQIG